VLAVTDVSRRFGDRLAVDRLTFTVGAGEVFGLLGPNGAGKTTTLRMLGGLIPPTSGHVDIGGTALTSASAGLLRSRIGFLTETPGLWDQLTVADNMRVYARLFGVPDANAAVERSLRRFELWDRRGDRAALLSKGMKQKLALARALVHDPEILLLDEPTANLDPQTARGVRDLLQGLRERGRTVIVSTHNLDEVERIADRVALMNTRLVAVGAPAVLRREIFGRHLRVRFEEEDRPAATYAETATRAGATSVTVVNDHELLLGVRPSSDLAQTKLRPGPEQGQTTLSPGSDPGRTSDLVRALVDAGALVCDVREDQPPLEEVYLRLMDGRHP
jgi:ABC-2 type transport system ATP-binding protein